jgi:hypothetical protein
MAYCRLICTLDSFRPTDCSRVRWLDWENDYPWPGVLATWRICSENGPIESNYPCLLVRKHKLSIQSERSAMLLRSAHSLSRQRRSSSCASCSSAHQTIRLLLFSFPPTALSAMDKTATYLAAVWNNDRSYSGKSRTGGRKCSLASPTHHPPSTDQTTNIYENGPHAAGAIGKGGSVMEASPLDCSARDASQVASSGLSPLLEAEVKGEVHTSEGVSRDHRVNQGDGKQQSALGS